MTNIIEIVVRAKDEASAAIAKNTKSIQDLESAAMKAAIPFAALGAVGTALIAKTTMTAARTEELGVVIENLGRVSGYTEEELAETEDSIKKLGITTQGARTIMSRFMGAEIDLADATKLVRAAQDAAVIGMKDSTEAAQDLTYAIASMNPNILRQYGIILNLNDVYKETAERLDTTIEALTATEKRQGMLNMVLEKAGTFTGTYEAAMETAGKQMRSFRRYTEEMANELGEHYLPFLGMAIETTTDFAKAFLELDDSTREIIASTILYATVIAGSIAATMGMVVATSKLITALQALKLVMVAHPLLAIPTLLSILGVAAIQSAAAFNEQKKAVMEASQSLEEYQEGIVDLIPLVAKAGTGQRGFARDAQVAARATAELTAEQEWMNRQLELAIPWMERWEEEQREINRLIEDGYKATEAAAEVLSYDMANALAGNILGLRENIERYRELEDTVIIAHVNMGARVADYNKNVERLGIDRARALEKLEEKLQGKIHYILKGAHARSFEENEKILAWQRGLNTEELGDFNALWDEKERRRTEDYELANSQAWAAAEERRKAEEAARVAEMEALKAAQEERLILFTLEMAAHKGLLEIPLEGWKDVEIGAQEYFDLVKAGIIPVSTDVTSYMGGALRDINEMWEDTGTKGDTAIKGWTMLVDAAIPDVMDLGAEAEDTYAGMGRDFDTYVLAAQRDGRHETELLSAEIVDLADTTYKEASEMETSMGKYTIGVGKSITKTGDLERKTARSFKAIRKDVGKGIEKMDKFTNSIKGAIKAWNKLRRLEVGGSPTPSYQQGIAYVPSPTIAKIHEGEAVLTKRQAEIWRSQTMNFNLTGDVYGMGGYTRFVEEAFERAARHAV